MVIKETETQEFTFGKYEGMKFVSLKTYEQGKTMVILGLVEDDPRYFVFAGHITNDGDRLYRVDWSKRYRTEEEATSAYNRQVAKAKEEEQ